MNVAVKFSFKLWPFITFIVVKCWLLWCIYAILLIVSYLVFGYLFTILLFIFFVIVILYGAQDKLLFHPDPENLQSRAFVQAPSIFDLPFENIFIKSLDGTSLHLYFIKQPEDKVSSSPTLVFFHGNAGNMGHRLHNAAGLYSTLNCNVLLVEYRGYGLSSGSPSEPGICMDAQAAMDFLLSRQDVDHCQIIVFGRSLGGAVAIDLASRAEYASRIWCLILENTFTSIPEMAKTLFAWRILHYLPVCFYKNKFMSLMKIRGVCVPSLFVSGLNDGLVPPSMMVELYRNCGSTEKQIVQIRQGSHNDTWTCPNYYSNIHKFIQSIDGLKPAPPKHISVVTNI